MIVNYDVILQCFFKNYFYKVYFLNIQENKFTEIIKSYFAKMSILKIFYATLFIAHLTLLLLSQNVPTMYSKLFMLRLISIIFYWYKNTKLLLNFNLI